MYDKIRVMSEQLANQNKVIEFKHNSVLTACKEYGGQTEIANKIAGQLGNEVGQIRNVLLPVVKAYASAVNKKINDTKQPNELSKYTVIERRIPTVVAELQAKKYIHAKRKPIQIPTTTLIIPHPEEDISKVASFKNAVLDKLLEEVLLTFTEKELEAIWDKYLGNVSGTNNNISMLAYQSLENLNEVIVLMGIIYSIMNERPTGVRIAESTYKETMNLLYGEITNNIAMAIDKFEITTKIDRLVLGTKGPHTIVVNADVYDKYIETETVESLLGLLLSGEADKVTSLNDVKINAGKYLNKWELAVKREQIRETQQQANRFRVGYNLVIKDVLENAAGAAHELMEVGPDTIVKETEELVRSFSVVELSDIDFVARHVIGKIVFPSTNLFKFLNYMENYAKIDTKITSDEAATMAALDIIVDYLAIQFDIRD